ncbi:MAG: hypothetical protein M1812_004540 [Candelaria pacifica]|nr:MAG: hypothetical protein M1812_004540 [Candelaria pacifica]
MTDLEKPVDPQVNTMGANQMLKQEDVEERKDVVLLDIEAAHLDGYDLSSIKVAPDGHTVLVPQPTDDPNDPLNWSWRKKHIILFVVSLTSFLADYSSAAGVPCIVLQGKEWKMNPEKVNYANSLSVAMMGLCGLLWITFVSFWGRAPVMFWSILTGTFFTLGCALSTNFSTFYAMRALMGVSLTAYQAVGLCVIKDMFFYHEHARKIGIWIASFVLSPYLGPMLGNFIIAGTGSWRNVFWVVFATCCADFVLVVAFMDESWYSRTLELELQPSRSGSRLLRVVGLWQIQNHKGNFLTVYEAFKRLFVVIFDPLMLLIFFY